MRHLEHEYQKALINWCHLVALPESPDIKPGAKIGDYIFAIPLGGKRNPREAARLKAEGVKAGVSDLFLPLPRSGYAGLWLEMKAPKGKPTKAQTDWLDLMARAGYRATWCDSWLKAAAVIAEYVGVKAPGRLE